MNVFIVCVVALAVNVFLGRHRVRYRKFTLPWWLLIHASIPLIIPLRIYLGTPLVFIPLFIVLAVLGQFIGSRLLPAGAARRGSNEK